jgi:hypothetical protein
MATFSDSEDDSAPSLDGSPLPKKRPPSQTGAAKPSGAVDTDFQDEKSGHTVPKKRYIKWVQKSREFLADVPRIQSLSTENKDPPQKWATVDSIFSGVLEGAPAQITQANRYWEMYSRDELSQRQKIKLALFVGAWIHNKEETQTRRMPHPITNKAFRWRGEVIQRPETCLAVMTDSLVWSHWLSTLRVARNSPRRVMFASRDVGDGQHTFVPMLTKLVTGTQAARDTTQEIVQNFQKASVPIIFLARQTASVATPGRVHECMETHPESISRNVLLARVTEMCAAVDYMFQAPNHSIFRTHSVIHAHTPATQKLVNLEKCTLFVLVDMLGKALDSWDSQMVQCPLTPTSTPHSQNATPMSNNTAQIQRHPFLSAWDALLLQNRALTSSGSTQSVVRIFSKLMTMARESKSETPQKVDAQPSVPSWMVSPQVFSSMTRHMNSDLGDPGLSD